MARTSEHRAKVCRASRRALALNTPEIVAPLT